MRPCFRLAPLALAVPLLCHAQGKLLLTGGVSSIDGAAGGGLTPWAVTASYATDGELGATAHMTRVKSQDYALGTWAGVIPMQTRVGAPEPDPLLPSGVEPPSYVSRYRRPGSP